MSRVSGRVTYPADFYVSGNNESMSMWFFGDSARECSCSSMQILSYQRRLYGPLLDRIDLVISVSRVPNDTLLNENTMNKKQHQDAINIINITSDTQRNRYKSSMKNNTNLTNRNIKTSLVLSLKVRQLLGAATDKLNLSARSYFKIIRVAGAIADLEKSDDISVHHVSEALQYRQST